ncbi:hypothetical protein [Flagellimonas oceanensis]|uniref:hypothetical protein n=1 Tax=Flagellimonas oceanensis TaxID=2499163 RepID=UPI003BAB77CC
MAVKHIDEDGNVTIHKGYKGGTTGCGFDTTENPSHWENTYKSITCEKNGCKN